jgi:hypothetical protein
LHLLKGAFLFGSPTTVMYRAEVVRARQPFFVLDRLHPDTEAVFEILKDHNFGFVPKILTFSRTQAESEMGSRRAFGPAALDRLQMVAQYGPHYLSPDELARTLKSAGRWHYSVLAQGLLADPLRKSSQDFWAYHQRGLDKIGKRVEPAALALAVGRLCVRSLMTPLQTARQLVKAK